MVQEGSRRAASGATNTLSTRRLPLCRSLAFSRHFPFMGIRFSTGGPPVPAVGLRSHSRPYSSLQAPFSHPLLTRLQKYREEIAMTALRWHPSRGAEWREGRHEGRRGGSPFIYAAHSLCSARPSKYHPQRLLGSRLARWLLVPHST